MPDMWTDLRQALLSSIVNLPERYYQIERYEGEEIPEVYRERVYCYELFHQLRNRLPEDFPYTLHGEIDKSGHKEICGRLGVDPKAGPNPDFVVHRPGRTGPEANLAVIEVKTCESSKDSEQKALDSLRSFVSKIEYQHGILLIFGEKPVEGLEVPDKRISIVWHHSVGEYPRIIDGPDEWQFEERYSIPGTILPR